MKIITLTQGQITKVDDADFDFLNQWKWRATYSNSVKSYYAERGGGGVHIFMHRFLLNPDEAFQVDHIDGDPLNNQRYNLRVCTPSQNACNRKKNIDNKSGYKGVTAHGKRWRVSIKYLGVYHHIGVFDTAIEAAKEYDKAAKKYHGFFARLNFLQQKGL